MYSKRLNHLVACMVTNLENNFQGNDVGECFVYDSETGRRQANVSFPKVSASVRACALTNDCRHLLAAMGNGFIFRFEYLGIEEGDEDADDNDDVFEERKG